MEPRATKEDTSNLLDLCTSIHVEMYSTSEALTDLPVLVQAYEYSTMIIMVHGRTRFSSLHMDEAWNSRLHLNNICIEDRKGDESEIVLRCTRYILHYYYATFTGY